MIKKTVLAILVGILVFASTIAPVLAAESHASSYRIVVGPDNREYGLLATDKKQYLVTYRNRFQSEEEAKNALVFLFKEAFRTAADDCVECVNTFHTEFESNEHTIKLSLDRSFMRTTNQIKAFASLDVFDPLPEVRTAPRK